MRYQDRIYIQNQNANVRNKNVLSVNTSSDFCVFESPTFNLSGGTKILCDEVTCEFSGITMQNYLSAATASCGTGLTQSCIDNINWSTKVYENDEFAYSATFMTTALLTGDTLTNTQFVSSVNTALNSLGYTYTKTDDRFDIEKKFGVNELDIDICISFDLLTTTACTFTGICSEYCESACTETFEGINSGSTGVHIIDTATTIDVTFDFTGNTDSFTATNATFKYKVYKYNHTNKIFQVPPIYTAGEFEYSSFSATNAITESIPVSNLDLDGEYLVKGYYVHDICTDFLQILGERGDTSLVDISTDKFGIYDANRDYYFVAMTAAATPQFLTVDSSTVAPRLFQQVIIPEVSGETIFTLASTIQGDPIVAVNGLTLAKGEDWNYIAPLTIQLSGFTVPTDIVTITYTTSVSNKFTTDIIDVTTPIVSGATDGQGTNKVYFNTTQGKYELFTDVGILDPNQIILTINGATLASGVDYYLSTSNNKRIILEGTIMLHDLITIHYIGAGSVIGSITTNTPLISWYVTPAPNNSDGRFIVEVAPNTAFSGITSSATTPYVTSQGTYSTTVTVTGSVGTELYYRVKNEKDYISIKGDKIENTAVSDAVPITITTNSINSY